MGTALATPATAFLPESVTESVTKTDGIYQLQSLDRAISVLEMLGLSDRPLSLADVCQQMHLHKSTAHRSTA